MLHAGHLDLVDLELIAGTRVVRWGIHPGWDTSTYLHTGAVEQNHSTYRQVFVECQETYTDTENEHRKQKVTQAQDQLRDQSWSVRLQHYTLVFCFFLHIHRQKVSCVRFPNPVLHSIPSVNKFPVVNQAIAFLYKQDHMTHTVLICSLFPQRFVSFVSIQCHALLGRPLSIWILHTEGEFQAGPFLLCLMMAKVMLK